MNTVRNWIRHHQVAAFFIIAFAITWGLGFSWRAVMQREQYLLLPLAFVTGCGPALAGIIISAIANTQPKQGSRRTFWLAFLVAWVVALLVYLVGVVILNHFTLSPVAVVLFAVSVLPVAFVMASTRSRNPSVRAYLASLFRLRGVWGWALVGMALFPGVLLLSTAGSSLLGLQSISDLSLPATGLSLVGLMAVKLFYQYFFFNATGEEAGWRGFALPRLQARTSPLMAALVIGIFWAPFHFFAWQAEGRPVLAGQFWGQMIAMHMLLSLVIVWVCNRAGGSILVAGVTHAAVNTVQTFIPIPDTRVFVPVLLVAILALILVDRMWEKLPADHPAVYQAPALEGETPGERRMPVPQYR